MTDEQVSGQVPQEEASLEEDPADLDLEDSEDENEDEALITEPGPSPYDDPNNDHSNQDVLG